MGWQVRILDAGPPSSHLRFPPAPASPDSVLRVESVGCEAHCVARPVALGGLFAEPRVTVIMCVCLYPGGFSKDAIWCSGVGWGGT